ncbi:MAG: ABC transporter permease subunit [Desulfarculaceae bacterium]|jgi:putative spermidine/putrescine transport system permease protein
MKMPDPSSLLIRLKVLLPAVPVLIFLVYFFGFPVYQILEGAVYSAQEGFNLHQFERITKSAVYAKVLTTTFLISVLTAVLSVGLGYPIAYFLSRFSGKMQKRWYVCLLVPFWTSYLVKAFAWILMLSRTGVLGSLSLKLGLTGDPFSLVPSLVAVLICMVHGMLPLAVLSMLPIMQGINRQLIQAAETLGADRISSFVTVFLPLSIPGAAAGGLLVFITSLGFFITPALLGTPSQTMVAQMVITAVQDLLDLKLAGALSVPLLVSAILIFFAYDRLVGLTSLAGETSTRLRKGGRLTAALRGGWYLIGQALSRLSLASRRLTSSIRLPYLKVYGLGVLIFLLLPIAIVIPIAFTNSPFLTFPPKGFSLKWFESFLFSPVWGAAILRSLIVATITAGFALALGLGASLSMARLPEKWSKSLFAFLIAPLIIPRIVIAVGLFYLFAQMGLAGTDSGLVIGHTVLAIPYVVVTMSAAFKQFDWRLDDAARILGASYWARLRTITLPLLLPGLISSFLFAFITSFDELTIAIFVSGGLKTTLPKHMWDAVQLQVDPTLAAVSTVMVLVISIALLLPLLFEQRTSSGA